MIAVLVKQMGGYASLTSSEVAATRGMNLSIITEQDPWGIKIKVTERD